MAAPKRTKLEREAQLVEIERHHNRGESVRDIAAGLGLHFTTIQRDLETIAQRYQGKTLVERTVAVNRMIATLRDVRKEAWEAWEKSKENKERQAREKISESLDAEGRPTAETLQRMKVVSITEGRLPRAEYLNIVLRTLKHEAELLGLYLPKEQHHEGNGPPAVLSVNVQEYQPPDFEQFRQLPISERIRWLQECKPSPAETNREGVPPEQVGA
jgi:hypothetical protein